MEEFIVNKISNSITYIIPTSSYRNCYLVDCGDVEKIIEGGWKIKGVLLTHAHTDHIYGINKLLEEFPDALIYTNEYGKFGLQNPRWNLSHYHYDVEDIVIDRLDNVCVIESDGLINLSDDLSVEAIFTPGHDPSCISYKIGDKLYTGDSYIPGLKVVTTFPRSNREDSVTSLIKLQNLETSGLKVLSGHWIPEIKSEQIYV